MPNVIISGINGKMGRLVYSSLKQKGFNIVCGIDHTIVGEFDCPVYKNFEEVKNYANVVIDFSSVENLAPLLSYCVNSGTPVVICTTGYSKNQEKLIYTASKKIPIFKTSNTSPGITVLIKLCKIAAKLLDDFDIEIIETHHSQKLDSPSGTTLEIVDELQSIKQLQPIFGRYGSKKRNNNEIGIHSVRGGSVVGEHEILFLGNNETISIKHSAQSKKLFADGAIKAAEFILDKPNGLYGMPDLFR